jgi:hypothetical protein
MRYVVGLMMAAFFLAGSGLFAAGAIKLIRRLAALRRLRRAEGKIVRVESRQEYPDADGGRAAEYHYPEIRFRPERGSETTFLSEIGAGASRARYAVGQKIGVLYDPEGTVAPMLDSWTGIWLTPLIQVVAGPTFVFVALFIYWAFADKIFAP